MRIACPVDPGLPRLPAALDDQILAGLVRARLRALGRADLHLEAVRPGYVRYKPGTSALVQVHLDLRSPDGALQTQALTLALYRGDHALGLADRRRSRALAADLPAGPWPLAGAWAEPDLGALAQGYPFDRGLPGLALAQDGPRLTRFIAASGTGLRPGALRSRLLRHKPGRRAVLVADADDGWRCYVKVGSELRPALLASLASALAGRGLRAPALTAAHPHLDLVVLEGLAGVPLASIPPAATGQRAMTALAGQVLGGLVQAQGLSAEGAGLPGLRVWEPQAVLDRVVTGLRAILPREADRLQRLAAAVEAACRRLTPRPTVLVHGDFYEDQVLLHPTLGPAYLDWDEAAWGPVSLDAACWLAHAQAAALEAESPPVAAEAIREAWLEQRPTEARPLALLAGLQALALSVGPFRRLEPDWPAAVRRRLSQAESDIRAAQAVTFAPARRLPVASTPLQEG